MLQLVDVPYSSHRSKPTTPTSRVLDLSYPPWANHGTLSLWLRKWVPFFPLACIQRVANHPKKSVITPVMRHGRATFRCWVHEDRPASAALFWGSNLGSPGSWPDITVSLEIFVRLSYLVLLCFWACLSCYTQVAVIFWPALSFFIPSAAL